MVTNEKYFNLYDELYGLLLRAYYDVYSLKEIECYNESIKNGDNVLIKSSFNVMSHICELLKADLGLIIWKVFSDTNSKANTLRSLCSKLRNISLEQSLNLVLPRLGLPSEFRSVEFRLSVLRKTFLAHNDKDKLHTSVKLDELIRLLGFLKKN